MIKRPDADIIIDNTNDLNDDMVKALYETLEELNPYALDISNVYNNPNTNTQIEMVKIYAEALYFGIQKALNSAAVITKLREKSEQLNVSTTFDEVKFYKKLIREYFSNYTIFKQSKGLNQAIRYAYNIIATSGLQPDLDPYTTNDGFRIEWGTEENPDQPFTIKVEGLLDPILYEGSVKQIAHPVGFAYVYTVTKYLEFTEYIDDWFTYKVNEIKISTTVEYSFDEYDYSDRTVVDIQTAKDVQNRERITIVFDNNEMIVKDFNRKIYFYNADGSIQKEFPEGYILDLDYNIEFEFRLKDEFEELNSEGVYWDYVWDNITELDLRKNYVIGDRNLIIGKFPVQPSLYTGLDLKKIGDKDLIIGKFPIQQNLSDIKIKIGNIDYAHPYKFPDEEHEYYPPEMEDFITKAINKNMIDWMKDDFETRQYSDFTEIVVNEVATIGQPTIGRFVIAPSLDKATIGKNIKVGEFIFDGVGEETLVNGTLLLDYFRMDKETNHPNFEETFEMVKEGQFSILKGEELFDEYVSQLNDTIDYENKDWNPEQIKDLIVPEKIGKHLTIGNSFIISNADGSNPDDNAKKIGKDLIIGNFAISPKPNNIGVEIDAFYIERYGEYKDEYEEYPYEVNDTFEIEKEINETILNDETFDTGKVITIGETEISEFVFGSEGDLPKEYLRTENVMSEHFDKVFEFKYIEDETEIEKESSEAIFGEVVDNMQEQGSVESNPSFEETFEMSNDEFEISIIKYVAEFKETLPNSEDLLDVWNR